MASHCSIGRGALYVAIISVGLIDDDAVVACNGVTACDHAKALQQQSPVRWCLLRRKACASLHPLCSLNAVMMDQSRFRTLPLTLKNGVVQNSFVSWETRNVGAGFVRSCA